MKRLFFSVTIILLVGALYGQALQKGNLLGIHTVAEPTLNAGVTVEQFEDFFFNKYVPAYQKLFSKYEVIPMKGVRGEHADKLGMIIIMKTEKDRNIYFNEDGSFNEAAQALLEKLQPVLDEANKLGTSVDLYTDWLVK